jgi:hypothetical protein
MIIGQVNDEGVPLDNEVNMKLSKVYGLAARQRVSLTLQGFNDLIKMKRMNSSKTLFKHTFNIWKS